MGQRISGLAAAFALLGAAVGAAPHAAARPIVPSEHRYAPFDSVMPGCGDAAPLNAIVARFHERESEYWRTGLEIVAFDEIREIGFRTNGLDYIPRRYCEAYAHMNDAKVRSVSYSISKDLAIPGDPFAVTAVDVLRDLGIANPFSVDWCVQGLDRLYANAPNCKMARP